MQLAAKIRVIFNNILRSGAVVAGVIVWFVLVLVWLEVGTRNFTTYSLAWVIEIAEWSLLYICFLGAGWVLKNEGHVKMDIVLNRLNPKKQALFNTIMSIVGAIICLVIAWYSAEMTWGLFQRGSKIISVIEPPKGAITIIIPIGFFLLFIQFMRRAYGYLGRWRE